MSLTNRAIGLSLLAVASLMVTEAQAPPTVSVRITDGTVPPTLAPGGPIGSYLNSDIEQVSVLNGKLNVTVPLLAVGGRGEAGYTITVPVHQPTWSVRVDTFSNDAHCDSTLCHYQFTSDPELVFSDPEYQSGFGPGRILVKHAADGMSACTDSSASPTTHYALRDAISYIVFVSPDGTEHALYDGPNGLDHETFSDSTTCAVALGKDRGRVFKSRDGSGMTYIIDAKQSVVVDYHSPDYQYGATTAPDGTLYMKNGVHYVQAAGQIKRIIDRNGNTVSLTYKSITTGGFVSTYLVDTITDSAGRTIHCDYELPSASLGIAPGYTVDTLNYQTQGGASQTIYVLRASLSSYLVPNSDTNQLLFPNHGGSLYIASVPDALVGILLPHQALTDAPGYQFRYTKYGEIGSVQLPSGGFISYTHGAGLPLGNGVFASGQVLSRLTGSSSAAATGSGGISAKPPWRPFIYRRLLRKDVYQSATDAQVPISWVTYSLPETSGAATLASDNTSYLNVTISTANASGPMVTVTKGGQAVANPVVENHYFLTSSDCTSEGTCSGRVNVSQNIYGPAAKLQYASLNPLTGFNDEWEGKESKTEWPGIKYVERSYGIVNNAALACREDEVHLKVGAAGTSLRKVSQTLYDSNENPTDVYEFPFVSGGSLPNGTSPAGLTGTVCQAVGSGYTRHSKTTFLYTNYAATPISLGTLVQERDVYDDDRRPVVGCDSLGPPGEIALQ